jgi:UDP-glucose 4-epimerase
MRVLVTGARGKVGSFAAAALRAAGHRVTTTDIGAPVYGVPVGLPYYRADLTDYGQAVATVTQAGAEAIVHAAGIPDMFHDPAATVFANNITATFNLTEAVARLGIGRFVYISSETVLGFVSAEQPFQPAYLPVDEELARRPQEAYSLSKSLGEDICDALVARTAGATTAVSIRPSFVLGPADYPKVARMRSAKQPTVNHWSYVDVEDLAELIALAVGTRTPGHEVVYAAQPDNLVGDPFTELVTGAFGAGAPPIGDLEREDSGGISIAKARRLFGWDPKRSWRDHLDDTDG